MSQDDLAALEFEYKNDMLHSWVARYERLKAWVDNDHFFEMTLFNTSRRNTISSVL